MTKQSVFIITIIGLVLINLILLRIVMIKPEPPTTRQGLPRDRPKMVIIERLEFDEKQVRKYVTLVETHSTSIRKKDMQIAGLKEELYQLLAGNLMITKADSLTTTIANVQKEIETLHFNHFKDIKGLCNEKQLPKFDELTDELAHLFRRRRRRR